MLRELLSHCLITIVICSCNSTAAERFRLDAEKGVVRCGYEGDKDNVDESGFPIDHHCDVTNEELAVCCSYSGDPADSECMTKEECGNIQQERNKQIIWHSECDDPSDCYVKYPDDDRGGTIQDRDDWVCCSYFTATSSNGNWSKCMSRQECNSVKDYNTQCLSTWNCPDGLFCIENIFRNDNFYCQESKDNGE